MYRSLTDMWEFASKYSDNSEIYNTCINELENNIRNIVTNFEIESKTTLSLYANKATGIESIMKDYNHALDSLHTFKRLGIISSELYNSLYSLLYDKVLMYIKILLDKE